MRFRAIRERIVVYMRIPSSPYYNMWSMQDCLTLKTLTPASAYIEASSILKLDFNKEARSEFRIHLLSV